MPGMQTVISEITQAPSLAGNGRLPPSSHAAAGCAAQDGFVFLSCIRLRIALRYAGNIKSGVPLQERRLVDYCRVIS